MTDVMSAALLGSREKEIGTSGDLIIYKKLKRLTGIFIGCV